MTIADGGRVLRLAAPQPDSTPQFTTSQEIGVPFGSPLFSVSSTGEILNPLADEVSVHQLIEMRKRDGQVRALMRLLTLPIRASLKDSVWEAADGDKGEQEFATNMFTLSVENGGMVQSWSRFWREMMLALVEGFSSFEEVRYIPKSGPNAGKIVVQKLLHLASDTIRFKMDDHGGYEGVRQITTFKGKTIDTPIPAEKTFYYAANEEENPFYGVSYFLPAFYHYDKKRRLYYLAHQAAAFRAVPGRIGSYPPGATDKEKADFEVALRQFGFDQSLSKPEAFTIDKFEPTGTFDFLTLIDHHDHMMAKSVLAQFIDDTGKAKLVQLDTSEKSDMFKLATESIMDEMAATVNQHLIPKYIQWNFKGSEAYPTFRFGSLSDEVRTAIRDAFNALMVAATPHATPDFMFEIERKMAEQLGLTDEIDYDKLKAENDRQKAMDAQLNEVTHTANVAGKLKDTVEAQQPIQPTPPPQAPSDKLHPITGKPIPGKVLGPPVKLPPIPPLPSTTGGIKPLRNPSTAHLPVKNARTEDELIELAAQLLEEARDAVSSEEESGTGFVPREPASPSS